MIFKIIIVSLLLIVVFSLGHAAMVMTQGNDKDGRMLKSLTWRIGLSVFIFMLLLIGQATGLITPHAM